MYFPFSVSTWCQLSRGKVELCMQNTFFCLNFDIFDLDYNNNKKNNNTNKKQQLSRSGFRPRFPWSVGRCEHVGVIASAAVPV